MKISLDLDHPDEWARALEGLIAVNRAAIRRGEVPADLYSTDIEYRKEKGTENWITALKGLELGWMDCEDLVGYRVAALREAGEHGAKPGVKRTGRTIWHAIVVRENGDVEDPTRILQGKDPMPYNAAVGQEELEEEAAAAPIEAEPEELEFTWLVEKLPRGQGWGGVVKIPLAVRKLYMSGRGDEYEDYQVIGWITGRGRGGTAAAAGLGAMNDAHGKAIEKCRRMLARHRQRQIQGERRDLEYEEFRERQRERAEARRRGREKRRRMEEENGRRPRDRRRDDRRNDRTLGFFPGLPPGLMAMIPGMAPAAVAPPPGVPPAAAPPVPGMAIPGITPPGPAPGMPPIPGLPGLPPGVPGIPPEIAISMAAFKQISELAKKPEVKESLKKAAKGAKKMLSKLKLWGWVEAI